MIYSPEQPPHSIATRITRREIGSKLGSVEIDVGRHEQVCHLRSYLEIHYGECFLSVIRWAATISN